MKKTSWWYTRQTFSHAKKVARGARRALSTLSADERSADSAARVQRSLDELEKALEQRPRDPRAVEKIAARLLVQLRNAELIDRMSRYGPLGKLFGPPRADKGVVRQYAESIAWAVGIALLIRFFLFEPFKIPTGSMIPTLQIGDHIFVSKSAYGIKLPFTSGYLVRWSSPERGDIVVFPFPVEGHQDYGKDFIKRVIGLPGDHVQLKGNVLFINGEAVPTAPLDGLYECGGGHSSRPCAECIRQEEELLSHQYITQHCPDNTLQHPDWPKTLPSGQTPEFVVPEDAVFVMGDNRDNSADGRFWTRNPIDQFTPQYNPSPEVQTVPISLLKGRAVFIWWAEDKSRIFSLVD